MAGAVYVVKAGKNEIDRKDVNPELLAAMRAKKRFGV
jgi:hypothetical protein